MSERGNCWVLTDEQGVDWIDGDCVQHFPGREAAEQVKVAQAPAGRELHPRRLDERCVTLACACCETLLDEEGEGEIFHIAPSEIAEIAEAHGWGCLLGRWLCGACVANECEECRDPDSDEPKVALPAKRRPTLTVLPGGAEPDGQSRREALAEAARESVALGTYDKPFRAGE